MLIRSVACVGALTYLLSACTTDTPEGQTEPVAPTEEATPYPEDPDMAKADDPSSVPAEPSPDDEPIGELTEDPFAKDASPPAAEPEAPVAEDGLPVPDEGEPYGGAFEDKPQEFEPAPGGPSMPPEVKDDLTSPPAEEPENTATAAVAPKGKVTRYVDAILLNVRSKPSQKAPIVRRLLGGAKIYVTITGEWAKIKGGQWVRSRYLNEGATRRVSAKEAEKAWHGSRYKDTWKPRK